MKTSFLFLFFISVMWIGSYDEVYVEKEVQNEMTEVSFEETVSTPGMTTRPIVIEVEKETMVDLQAIEEESKDDTLQMEILQSNDFTEQAE